MKAAAGRERTKLEALEAADKARRQADAELAVHAAVSRGAIATLDEETKSRWKALCAADASHIALLEKVPGSPAFAWRMTPPATALATGGGRRGTVQVVAPAPRETVEAYFALQARQAAASSIPDKALIAREAAALYRADIRNNGDALDMPLSAANSVGTAAGTLVTQRVLELLKLSFPVLTAITTDFSDQQANYNQTITTRIISIPTVSTYNASSGWPQSDQTGTDVSITVNAHKGVQITFDSNTLASTVRRLFDEFAPAAAYALAKDLVDAVYGLITAANFTASPIVSALADFGRPTVVDLGTNLNIAGVPMGSANRTLLLYSSYFGALAKDAAIVSLAAFQQREILTNGILPDVHGFRVVDAPNLPAGSDHVMGFAFSKSALAVATRIPNDYTSILPGASFGNVNVVTDPDIGISMLQTQFVDHSLGNANQRIAWMYGKAKGQAAAGQLLASQ